MEQKIYEYLPVIAICVSVITFLFLQFGIITTIRERLASVETKVDIFWQAVGSQVKDMLKQPTHFRKDDLLERFPSLTDEELLELRDTLVCELRERKQNMPKDQLNLSYALMLGNIRNEMIERSKQTKSGFFREVLSHDIVGMNN